MYEFIGIADLKVGLLNFYLLSHGHFPADEDVLSAVHRFRPEFLVTANALPSHYDPYEFKHTCLLPPPQDGDTGNLTIEDNHLDPAFEKRRCVSLPFVSPKDFQSSAMAGNLTKVITEVFFF